MKIIVGLGNPGNKYENTPHNVGFAVVDELAVMLSCRLHKGLRFRAGSGRAEVAGQSVLLVKPMTYMNNSGEAVAAIARYHKVDVVDVIVVSDDADLQIGSLRIRAGGGAGGHKGLNSIVQHVGSKEFARVRLGIGRGDGSRQSLVDHVLEPFSRDEKLVMDKMIGQAAKAVICMLESGTDVAMNKFNGRQDIEKI